MSVAKAENSSSPEFSIKSNSASVLLGYQDDPLSSQTQTKRTFTFTSSLIDPSRKDYQMIKSCLLAVYMSVCLI